jgi:hypothetical protein
MLRQRAPKDKKSSVTKTSQATQPPRTGPGHAAAMDTVDDPQQPLLGARDDAALSQRHLSSPSQDRSSEDPQQERFEDGQAKEMENLSKKSQWIVLALASGACAAFNGVFAKLYVILVSSPEVPVAQVTGKEIYFFSCEELKQSKRRYTFLLLHVIPLP